MTVCSAARIASSVVARLAPPTNGRLSNLTGVLFKLRGEGLSRYDHPAIRQTRKDGRGCGSTTHLLMLAEE